MEDRLFILPTGQPLTAHRLREEFKRFQEAASISERAKLSILRKTLATHLRIEGVDTLIRADIMGHAVLDTQRHYAASSFDEVASRALKSEGPACRK